MRVLVTGGTGFVGRTLLPKIESPIVVSRKAITTHELGLSESASVLTWADPALSLLDIGNDVLPDAVVHLMGEPIANGRWTAAKKRRVRESRVVATERLVESLARLRHRPSVFVSASAMGYYGSRGDQLLDEAAPSGTDWLADVCREWEESASRAQDLGIRVVLLRIGIVLGQGGFLKAVLPIFRRGLGGKLSNGRQWVSWIHVADLVRLIQACINDQKFSGPVNAASPVPVRNIELTRELAKAVGRPAILPVPYFALRLLAGELATAMIASIRLSPAKAIGAGFEFKFPRIQEALADLLGADEA